MFYQTTSAESPMKCACRCLSIQKGIYERPHQSYRLPGCLRTHLVAGRHAAVAGSSVANRPGPVHHLVDPDRSVSVRYYSRRQPAAN